MMQRVHEIGEQGLLRRVQQFCPAEVVGDDAAVLAVPPDRSLVITTDVLVDGVHFSDCTTSAFDAGWRAVAANLSDLAAMAATPLGITVGLGLPSDCPVAWVETLYQGMVACLQPFATPIVGGDICHSSVRTLAITAFGHVHPQQVCHRSTARPGDVIVATGPHGLSKAGLEILLGRTTTDGLSPQDRQSFIQAHQRPIPRLDVPPLLQQIFSLVDANLPPASWTGMDSSDGLADAIVQICRASGVGAVIDRHRLPMPAAFLDWLPPAQALDWLLYGGEDFELVLCLPAAIAQVLQAQLSGVEIVGEVTDSPEVVLIDSRGQYPPEPLTLTKGFQHFQPS